MLTIVEQFELLVVEVLLRVCRVCRSIFFYDLHRAFRLLHHIVFLFDLVFTRSSSHIIVSLVSGVFVGRVLCLYLILLELGRAQTFEVQREVHVNASLQHSPNIDLMQLEYESSVAVALDFEHVLLHPAQR